MFYRDLNGDFIQEYNPLNLHVPDDLPELYVPNLELDAYENCRNIPKHKINCASDVVQIAGMDKSGFFLSAFFLSNITALIDYMKKRKLKFFIEKFNSKSRELLQAKYSGKTDFSDHKFIEHKDVSLFKGLMTSSFGDFWRKIIKKWSNTVVKLTPQDEQDQLKLKNDLDEMSEARGMGDNSVKMIASRLGIEYTRARRLTRV
jgi:hypothetical protein